MPYKVADEGEVRSGEAREFEIYPPQVLGWDNCDDFDITESLQAFWSGLGEHEQGAAIWNECLIENK